MDLHRRTFMTGAAALGAGFLADGAFARAETPLSELITPKQMSADLDLIRQSYGLLHPGLTRYLPAGGFDQLAERARAWGARERTPSEFYVALARLTAAVKCGHTHANPANQQDIVQTALIGRADRMPFCAIWIDGGMVVTEGLSSGLVPGTIIRTIDGIATERMLLEMLPLTRADGHNDGKRVAQLELHRGDRYAAFDVFRSLLYSASVTGTTEVQVELPGGAAKRLTLKTAAEGSRGTPARDDPQYGWRFTIDDAGIGILTMPDWSLYNSKWDWRAFLNDVVDELISARARGLVVDLRENEGGIDCGDTLLTRLIDRPIDDLAVRRLVRFRETPVWMRPKLDTWDPSFHTIGVGASIVADRPGYFDLGSSEARRIEPAGHRFQKPVAILVSATCSSATFDFARLVKQTRTATLIGTSTGGNLRGINGGSYFFVRLPGSGFEVDLPLIGYFPTTPQPDAGVAPDIIARPSVSALIAGRDLGMDAMRRAILQ